MSPEWLEQRKTPERIDSPLLNDPEQAVFSSESLCASICYGTESEKVETY